MAAAEEAEDEEGEEVEDEEGEEEEEVEAEEDELTVDEEVDGDDDESVDFAESVVEAESVEESDDVEAEEVEELAVPVPGKGKQTFSFCAKNTGGENRPNMVDIICIWSWRAWGLFRISANWGLVAASC